MIWEIATVLAGLLTYKLIDYVIRSSRVDSLGTKYVFITGCDTGFGHHLALHLDSLGIHVFAGCFSEEGQNNLSKRASPRLIPLSLDVTDSESIQNALSFVKQKLPHDTGLWAIVNNAGVAGVFGPAEICTKEHFHKPLAVNLLGPIEICKRFLPLVRKSKGRVVNMSSSMGRLVEEALPYNVSKFGMEAFSDCLRQDLYSLGVKVSIIEPGAFRTNVIDEKYLETPMTKAFEAVDGEVREAYGGTKYIETRCKMLGGVRETMASKDLSPVVDAYTHAITSRYPRTRYVVGLDANLILIPLATIPTGIADWIIYFWKSFV